MEKFSKKKLLIYQAINNRHLRKANVINTINIAKGFKQNNLDLEFYVNDNKNLDFLKKNLNGVNLILQLPKKELINYINKNISIVYCRDSIFPKYLIENNYNGYILCEDHSDEKLQFFNLYQTYEKFIFITISPKIAKINSGLKKILVYPCAIDFDYFSDEKIFLKTMFNKNSINISYCGSLYEYKGISLIVKAAQKLPQFNFHIVGGRNREEILRYKNIASKNIIFYGLINYNEIPNYLYSSDLLLIPYNRRGNKFSKSNITSPIKLFEYLSTKKPVLCSDIEGIKNWVSDDEVYFFKASNLDSFCNEIKKNL